MDVTQLNRCQIHGRTILFGSEFSKKDLAAVRLQSPGSVVFPGSSFIGEKRGILVRGRCVGLRASVGSDVFRIGCWVRQNSCVGVFWQNPRVYSQRRSLAHWLNRAIEFVRFRDLSAI